MNKSESIAALAGALAKAQGEIYGAVKDSTNPHFKSKYADLSSVVDAIRPAFKKYNLCFVQTIHEAPDSVGVETIIMHESGEWLSNGVIFIPVGNKRDAHAYGSALTYCRRYSLSAATGVAPEDDDGNAAVAGKAAVASKPLDKSLQEDIYQVLVIAAENGLEALQAAFKAVEASPEKQAVWKDHSASLKSQAEKVTAHTYEAEAKADALSIEAEAPPL